MAPALEIRVPGGERLCTGLNQHRWHEVSVEVEREYPCDRPGVGNENVEDPRLIPDKLYGNFRRPPREIRSDHASGGVRRERGAVLPNAHGGPLQGSPQLAIDDACPQGLGGRGCGVAHSEHSDQQHDATEAPTSGSHNTKKYETTGVCLP